MRTKTAVTWPVFQVVTVAHALAVAAQPVLAGRFLSGDVAALDAHSVNGSVAGSLGIGLFVLALIDRLVDRPAAGGRWRLVFACLALAGAEAAQVYFGHNRVIGPHVPLGVAIVAAAVWLPVWAWRPGLGRRP